MSKVVIKAEDISKQYRLGLVGTGTVRDDMKRWWYNIRGKEDPFLKIGESNDRATKGESDYVWSLKDINFEINQGDSVGIIGRNGAGKSTLLKILSQVTQPTTGRIYTKGRIASLLEVGTGFHPEMTGRENIYLNGAILGMRKHEITRKMDEIIAFSGVERYIDTPVKRYSSGMYVRLAFAVAAHLESEILIVDEVLAVGDAEFQKKCLGKMSDVSKGEGRTVLFVSHNMAAVKSLCDRGIVLENGWVSYDGEIEKGVDQYLSVNDETSKTSLIARKDRIGIGNVIIDKVRLPRKYHKTGAPLIVEITYKRINNVGISEFGISIWNSREDRIISISSIFKDQLKNPSDFDKVRCEIPSLPLVKGKYLLNCFISSRLGIEDYVMKVLEFYVEEDDIYGNGKTVNPEWGMIIVDHNWIQ